MTEQELEKLFRSKLASGEYQYNPAAWNAMENLLDQNAVRGGGYFWRSAAAILAFAFVIGSLSYWQTSGVENDLPLVSVEMMDEVRVYPLEDDNDPVESSASITSDLRNTLPDQPLVADDGTASNDLISSIDENESPIPNQKSPAGTAVAEPITGAYAIASSSEPSFISANEKESLALVDLNAKGVSDPSMKLTNETRSPFILESKSFYKARQSLYLKGGTVINEAHNNSNMGVGFHVGLEYQVGLSKQLDLSVGLTYSQINKVGIHQQFDSTFYNFSSERIETDITGRQLNYLEMPLSVNWRFHPRHQLGFGAYAALLLSVSEDVEKRHYSQNGEMNVDRHSDEGKLSPYESYDMGLAFSYFYMIDSQLEIGLEVRRGITDITKDTESVYVQNHQNLNTRLSLRYRIL